MKVTTQLKALAPAQRSAWSVRAFCEAASISDAWLYKLDASTRPASIKIGRKRLITESPSDWLRRMAAAGSSTA